LRNGRRFVVNTDKTGNSLGGANGDPGIVGDNHLNKNITGEDFFLSLNFFTATDDHFALNWDNGLENFVSQGHSFNTGFESIDDFVFVTGVSVDNVPGGINAGFFRGKLKKIFFFLPFFGFFPFERGWLGDGSFFIGLGHCLRFLCQRSRLIPEEED